MPPYLLTKIAGLQIEITQSDIDCFDQGKQTSMFNTELSNKVIFQFAASTVGRKNYQQVCTLIDELTEQPDNLRSDLLTGDQANFFKSLFTAPLAHLNHLVKEGTDPFFLFFLLLSLFT